jgi:tripartite-type tricarboxylate transporter receptor subunit TctC
MPEHILRTLPWLLGGLALVLTSPVLATPVLAADFYQGKTLTVIVGYAPGGGVDAGARAITRHLGRFIPGHPNIVVQNMEGAAGMVSLNHLDRRVAPDGLTLAVPGRSWYIEAIVRRRGIGIDPTRLTYVGSPGAVSAAGFVHTRTGITTYAALKAALKPVTFGALGATTPTAMAPALLAANGAPVKIVLGYVSTARVLLALEQGEIDGTFTVGNALAARSDLAAKMATLLQTAPTRPGVPLLRDVVRAISRSSIWCRRPMASACRWLAPPACRPSSLLFYARPFWPWRRTRTTRRRPSGSTSPWGSRSKARASRR